LSERSQVKVDLEIADTLGRFRKELEIAVFRIVQEALSNVHRHSKSDTARIEISATPRQLRVTVEDQGKGIISRGSSDSGELNPGVGISGIRERVRQLGGQMQIRSGESGTALDVVFRWRRQILNARASSRASFQAALLRRVRTLRRVVVLVIPALIFVRGTMRTVSPSATSSPKSLVT
jgi:signal transduction histidine kinase